MKNKFSDEQLDRMLKRYYSLDPLCEFTVNENHKHQRAVKQNLIRGLAAAACLIFIFVGILIYSNNFKYILPHNQNTNSNENTSAQSGGQKNPFIIQAYAAELSESSDSKTKTITDKELVARGGVYIIDNYVTFNKDNFYLSMSDEYPLNTDERIMVYPKIVSYHVSLDIMGDNVKSFDVHSDRGYFNYLKANRDFEQAVNFDVTPEIVSKIMDNPHLDSYDYGNNAIGIEYSSDKTLFWFPDLSAVDKDIKALTGINKDDIFKTCKKETFDKYFEGQTQVLAQKSLNDYVADTIRFTLYFDDGSKGCVNVGVSLDSNGNFIVNYV